MTAILGKLLPLLNKAIPAALAVKTMGSIDPRLSKFAQAAAGAGYTADHIIGYLREHLEPIGQTMERKKLQKGESEGSLRPDELKYAKQRKNTEFKKDLLSGAIGLGAGAIAAGMGGAPAAIPAAVAGGAMGAIQGADQPAQENQQSQSIVAQIAPALDTFIRESLSKGRSLDEAGALAQVMGPYNRDIAKLEKVVQANFSDILNQEYGQQQPQPEQILQPPHQQMPQVNQGQQAQQQGMSPGDQALADAINNLRNIL